ncbi:sensor histidine kinase [Nocardia crassostreae]|uniref:sensor histidine kinase n=1 Tax=Nocardia crassostreae TaxID=53428 RepID=UPI00082F882F|nr:nitrate- and nitrite sensing domain-containing protein [Nocardia crassostreae]
MRLSAASDLTRPRTIRARLRRILVVSVALVLALLTVIIVTEADRYRDTGDAVGAVNLALAVQDLVHELQRERGLTNGLLGGDGTLHNTVNDQRAITDLTLHALSGTLDARPAGADKVRAALEQLSGLSANRSDVDGGRIGASVSFSFYTNAILGLNQARPSPDETWDTALWRGLQTLFALGDVKEYTAQERGFLNGVFTRGEFVGREYVQFLDIRAGKQVAITAFARDATPVQRSRLNDILRSDAALQVGEAEAVAYDSVRGPLLEPVDAQLWWRHMTEVIDAEHGAQGVIGAEIRDRAATLRQDAFTWLAGYALAAALALAAQIALVVATVRAIVRPLADLVAEADEVAEQRLPQLIAAWHDDSGKEPDPPEPVRADESAGTEIVSVAHALDRVQATAFDLASAQARLRRNTTESMANLARRNQNLVRRQLGLISDFEREELDPKALSNLFELDHLATRMRRNAESLLVLVGESAPRRWSQPIPLSDVIRAGLSEVDDYRRVVLRRVDEVAITGANVSDLAHMLAELIENGLSFSPPDLEVEIYGRRMGQRYMIAVVDHGVGMPPDQLATANARLRGEADFLVAPTRFLGHFVVGRLAKRLGVEVELTVSPVSGVVARLLLPHTLLADESSTAPDLPAEPKHAAAHALPATKPAASKSVAALPAATTPATPETGRHSSAQPAPSEDKRASITNGAVIEAVNEARSPRTNGESLVPPIKLIPLADAPDSRAEQELSPSAEPAPLSANTSHGTVVETVPEVQRTRNGLVKRNRKTREHSGAAPGSAPASGTPPDASPRPTTPLTDRSPDQVRSRLAGFRTGHQRGERGEPPRPGSNP